MRKVTYGAAVSLDGFIAGHDDALDWLLWSDDASAISGASWKGVDTMLMGGGELAAALIEGGVVDEIGLNVHPVLLGGGVPMFAGIGRCVTLSLTEARPIARDCVFLMYRVSA
jgi:dihydrofolate reductase